MKRKDIQTMIEQATGSTCDAFTVKKDGTVVFKKFYFYRHGQTAEGFASRMNKIVGEKMVLVDTFDSWNAWPKDSYFAAVFKAR